MSSLHSSIPLRGRFGYEVMSDSFFSEMFMKTSSIFTSIVSLYSKNLKLKIFLRFQKCVNGIFRRHGACYIRKLYTSPDINESALVLAYAIFPNMFSIHLHHITWTL